MAQIDKESIDFNFRKHNNGFSYQFFCSWSSLVQLQAPPPASRLVKIRANFWSNILKSVLNHHHYLNLPFAYKYYKTFYALTDDITFQFFDPDFEQLLPSSPTTLGSGVNVF